ncbi:unnamed protein product, partial [Tetraodon nigroviridis]
PWFIGELIDGHKGACFAFGVFVDGHYLEGSLTYVVGVIQVRKPTGCFPAAHFLPLNLPLFQMLFFNMPLTAYLCWSVHPPPPRPHLPLPLPEAGLQLDAGGRPPGHAAAAHLAGAVLPLPPGDYGLMSFLMSPVRTWALGLGLLLVYRAWTGPSSLLQETRNAAPS